MRNSGIVRDETTGLSAKVEARTATPTGNALNVQIGLSDAHMIPVVEDYVDHLVIAGETFQAVDPQATLNQTTVKYGITVATYADLKACPRIRISADAYVGGALVNVYEVATFSGGTLLTKYNKNRNSAATDATTVKTGVTSTDGTLIDQFYTNSSRAGSARKDFILKSNTIYRVDVIGQAATSAAIVGFEYTTEV